MEGHKKVRLRSRGMWLGAGKTKWMNLINTHGGKLNKYAETHQLNWPMKSATWCK